MQTIQEIYVKEISACRVCSSTDLETVIDLGNLAISGFVRSQKEAVYVPLALALCRGCGFLQLRHSVDPDTLFKHFWYQSGISSSMRSSLKEIVDAVRDRGILRGADWMIDIGCNDGTLLKMFPSGVYKSGYEPAVNMAELARKSIGERIFNEYFSAQSYLQKGYGKPKLITAIAMFYDLEDPAKFCRDIVQLLRQDGTFLVQMNYLPSMLENDNFDNICHEHLGYYSLKSLKRILGEVGLEAYDVELNAVNGGSFRIYIGFRGEHQITGRISEMEESEKRAGLWMPSVYRAFVRRISENGVHLRKYLFDEKAAGRKTWIMGASTRGNTLLQVYQIDKTLVEGAVDKNPEKWGLRTVGTDIPIWSRTEALQPDNFLILPYHFLDEFKDQEKNYLRKGGRFLVPLPKFRVVS
jgi:NDP-4-keto-2,6-dideoxyhexose 3-C-methyltransferase